MRSVLKWTDLGSDRNTRRARCTQSPQPEGLVRPLQRTSLAEPWKVQEEAKRETQVVMLGVEILAVAPAPAFAGTQHRAYSKQGGCPVRQWRIERIAKVKAS